MTKSRVFACMFAALMLTGCSQQDGKIGQAKKLQSRSMLACHIKGDPIAGDAVWSQLRESGIRFVEISVPQPEALQAVKDQLAQHGLTAIMLSGTADLSTPRCVDEIARQLETCREMNVHLLSLSILRRGASREAACERLWKAGEIARGKEVRIALEMQPDMLASAAMALATLQRIRQPNVQLNFDTGNIYYYNQGASAVEELEKIAPYVAAVHLKDSDGTYQSWNFPTLGKGIVDFKDLIQTLTKQGFKGPCVIEPGGTSDAEMSEAETRAYFAESIAHLRFIADFR